MLCHRHMEPPNTQPFWISILMLTYHFQPNLTFIYLIRLLIFFPFIHEYKFSIFYPSLSSLTNQDVLIIIIKIILCLLRVFIF